MSRFGLGKRAIRRRSDSFRGALQGAIRREDRQERARLGSKTTSQMFYFSPRRNMVDQFKRPHQFNFAEAELDKQMSQVEDAIRKNQSVKELIRQIGRTAEFSNVVTGLPSTDGFEYDLAMFREFFWTFMLIIDNDSHLDGKGFSSIIQTVPERLFIYGAFSEEPYDERDNPNPNAVATIFHITNFRDMPSGHGGRSVNTTTDFDVIHGELIQDTVYDGKKVYVGSAGALADKTPVVQDLYSNESLHFADGMADLEVNHRFTGSRLSSEDNIGSIAVGKYINALGEVADRYSNAVTRNQYSSFEGQLSAENDLTQLLKNLPDFSGSVNLTEYITAVDLIDKYRFTPNRFVDRAPEYGHSSQTRISPRSTASYIIASQLPAAMSMFQIIDIVFDYASTIEDSRATNFVQKDEPAIRLKHIAFAVELSEAEERAKFDHFIRFIEHNIFLPVRRIAGGRVKNFMSKEVEDGHFDLQCVATTNGNISIVLNFFDGTYQEDVFESPIILGAMNNNQLSTESVLQHNSANQSAISDVVISAITGHSSDIYTSSNSDLEPEHIPLSTKRTSLGEFLSEKAAGRRNTVADRSDRKRATTPPTKPKRRVRIRRA